MAAHVSNFNQANNKIVLDLINEQNAQSLPEGSISFGAPTEVVAGQIATTLVTTAQPGSGYRGSVELTYNRVPLSFMDTNEPDLVLETDATTTQGLIPALNAAFGILLTNDDITDAPIPELEPDVDTTVALTATATTLVWHGSVDLTLTKTLVELSSVLTTTTLDGLYPPTAG